MRRAGSKPSEMPSRNRQADGALVEVSRRRQPGHDAAGGARGEPDYSPDYQVDSKGRLRNNFV